MKKKRQSIISTSILDLQAPLIRGSFFYCFIAVAGLLKVSLDVIGKESRNWGNSPSKNISMTEKSVQTSLSRDNQRSPGVMNMEILRFSIFLQSKNIQKILKNYGYRNQKSRQLYFIKHLNDWKIFTKQSC